MDIYLAAATALERWGYDQTEREVLRRDLEDARRRLTERMDSLEKLIGTGDKAVADGLALSAASRGRRKTCGKCSPALGTPPQAAARGEMKDVRRILVAVDDSDPGRWAVSTAVNLARPLGAELVLLHVINLGSVLTPDTVFVAEDVRGGLVRTADDLLAAAHALVGPGVSAERLTREGDAGDEIVAAAAEWAVDLIVVGTRSRGRLASFLLGSTAESVIRRSACPVLTVAHDPAERSAASPVVVLPV
jgi:nucleotide-binding universal stress UspA family protein